MPNHYHQLAHLCDQLSDAFLGKPVQPMPEIMLSHEDTQVVVKWSAWLNLTDIERSELITEAYYQAFGTEHGLRLKYAQGILIKTKGSPT
jgi:hypothetical protein